LFLSADLSAVRGTLLPVTTASAQAVIPAWVVPAHRRVVELHYLVYRFVEVVGTAHFRGQLAAVEWVVGRGSAPVTGRPDRATWPQARAESWVALCVAAQAPEPTGRDWVRLGVQPRLATVDDPDWAHGAWRTLAWLLGVRPEPPVELPERDEDGQLAGGPLYTLRPDPASQVWRAVETRRREWATEDARRHWQHVRRLADR
jgi:hypothetical protein